MGPGCVHSDRAAGHVCLQCRRDERILSELVRLGRMATYVGLTDRQRRRLVAYAADAADAADAAAVAQGGIVRYP